MCTTIGHRPGGRPEAPLTGRSHLVKMGLWQRIRSAGERTDTVDGLLDQVADLHCEAPLPRMVRVRQRFDAPVLGDIAGETRAQVRTLLTGVRPGMRVGITAGSRGVANIALILRAAGEAVRERGGEPFVLPAMGSHGGATAEGQVEVLEGYGVTEESTGMPVVSSMEVRQIGQLGSADDPGPAVYLGETALAADGLIVCNRVKPHTDFRGELESGLAKITAIGMGKHQGAKTIHSFGTRGLAHWMPQAASCMTTRAAAARPRHSASRSSSGRSRAWRCRSRRTPSASA